MNAKDELIDWLRDAYAMERAIEMALGKQIDNVKVSQEMREQASIHFTETQGHAQAVHDCLHKLGADVSTLKNIAAQGLEFTKSAMSMFARDERVKDAIAAYASEHFEIACYTALKTAAQKLGSADVASMCDAILKEEMAMAEWLGTNLPSVVHGYLSEK